MMILISRFFYRNDLILIFKITIFTGYVLILQAHQLRSTCPSLFIIIVKIGICLFHLFAHRNTQRYGIRNYLFKCMLYIEKNIIRDLQRKTIISITGKRNIVFNYANIVMIIIIQQHKKKHVIIMHGWSFYHQKYTSIMLYT